MADQFSKMYDFERVGGDQRTRLAEMLRANALNAPQGQMVGGWYVAPSWTQNLAQLANTALGTYLGNQVDEERKAKTAEILRDLSKGKAIEQTPLTQNFNGLDQRAEGQTPFPQQPQTELQKIAGINRPTGEQSQMNPAMVPQQVQQYRPLTEEEKIGKVMELAQYNPYAANIWSAQDTARQQRAMKLEDEASRRAWQSQENQLNREGRMDMARLTAALAASNRPERMLTVMDETGTPFTVPQSAFQPGMTLYTPATAKAFQEKAQKAKGQGGVSETLDVLKTQYDVLQGQDAMPSTQNRWGTNLGAKIAGTGLGQWTGQVFGTKAQEARDIISQTRPLLLADIKKATGMTASEMNSNAELQMWLSVATDPNKGYEANMEALKNLENKFGLGRGGVVAPQQTGATSYGAPPAGAVREKK